MTDLRDAVPHVEGIGRQERPGVFLVIAVLCLGLTGSAEDARRW